MAETGFTGPVSEFNRTTGFYPVSVRNRFSERKPRSHAYAPLSPVPHYNPAQGDLVGGNFWDMHATGRRLGKGAAEQESRSQKSGQDDRWNFCLTAGTLVPANQEIR